MDKTSASKQIRRMHYELKMMFNYKRGEQIEKYTGKRIDTCCRKLKIKQRSTQYKPANFYGGIHSPLPKQSGLFVFIYSQQLWLN